MARGPEMDFVGMSLSPKQDCETIVKLGLDTKNLTHIRCDLEDARLAVESGVYGVDVVV